MDHIRHQDIFNAKKYGVTLIGAGGIGAATALCLVKMGVGSLHVIEPDTVSEENLATQLYPLSALGKPKVNELTTMLKAFADDTRITSSITKVTSDYYSHVYANHIMISAVDSITSRKDIFSAIQKLNYGWYLDARMSAEKFHLYCVKKDESPWYVDMLADQLEEDVPELPCTAKATIYTAFLAAGHIGSMVKRIITTDSAPHFTIHDIDTGSYLEL